MLSIIKALFTKTNRSTSNSNDLGFDENDKSFYRRWILIEIAKQEQNEKLDEPAVFCGIMLSVAMYSLADSPSDFSVAEIDKFQVDTARFEVGCYLLSAIDRWMYSHMSDHRERLMKLFLNQFAILSSQALSISSAAAMKLLNDRMTFYESSFRNGASESDLVERLTDFVFFASESAGPFEGKEPPVSLDLKRIWLLVKMKLWSDNLVPATFKILINYQQVSQKNDFVFGPSHIAKAQSHTIAMGQKLTLHNRVHRLVVETERVTETLYCELKKWVALPNLQGLELVNAAVMEAWREPCTSYGFALVCLSQYKADSTFFDGEVFQIYRANVAKLMTLTAEETLKKMNSHHMFNSETTLTNMGLELMKAQDVIFSFVRAIAADNKNPDSALLRFLADKIGVSGEMKVDFNNWLREFTKFTLRSLAAKKSG